MLVDAAITSSKNNHWHLESTGFSTEIQETPINRDTTGRTTTMQVWELIHSERGMKGRKRKAKDTDHKAGTTWSCESSSTACGGGGGGGGHQLQRHQFWVCLDFSLVCEQSSPVVSLWQPGIPHPVHGRVLVEIQRPRSLHRKAVIQLSAKRNQHNQYKQQVSHRNKKRVASVMKRDRA